MEQRPQERLQVQFSLTCDDRSMEVHAHDPVLGRIRDPPIVVLHRRQEFLGIPPPELMKWLELLPG